MSALDRLIWDRLTQYGMAPHHAAGVLGNFVQESGLRPDIENGIGAYGLGQWLGPRRKGLQEYAAKQGKDVSDPLLQVDYLIHELNGPESKAAKALQAATTPGEAAAIFRRTYERPGEAEANDKRRIAKAYEIFNKLSPIGTAYADEFPRSGPNTGWKDMNPEFNPADYGLVPDDSPVPGQDDERAVFDRMTAEQQGFNPADYGLVPDDGPVEQAAPQEPGWFDKPTGGLGDMLSGAGSALAHQAQGLTQGLQGAGQAMGMGENPAFRSMPLLDPEKMALLSATLKRDTKMGDAGEVAGDLLPYVAMSPMLAPLYAAGSTPGDAGERAMAGGLAAGGGLLGAGAARAVRGFTPSNAARTLMDEGVFPSLGQGVEQGTMGRAIRRAEEATTSLPLAGATTRSARLRPAEQWANAVLARAEAPELGIEAGAARGYQGVANLTAGFRRAYGNVLNGRFVPLDDGAASPIFGRQGNPLMQQINALIDNNPALEEGSREIVRNTVLQRLNEVMPSVQNGQVPAGMLKSAADDLGAQGALMLRDRGQDALRGRALLEADALISEHVNNHLPQEVQGLMQQIDARYANFKRIQRATAMARNPEGMFTPEELKNAVRLYDTSRDKARFAAGAALLQDLAAAGKAVIPETLGESGTTPRALMASVMKGGAAEAGGAMLGGLPAYGGLAAIMGAGSREPIQRALLGGYGWQDPLSRQLGNWLPQIGAGLTQ